jgi:hypothetical protein
LPSGVDHVALAVELAEDRVRQAVGLEPGPQLEAVLRQAHEVAGQVLVRERVERLAAVARVDLVQLLLHDRRALLLDERVEAPLQLPVALGPVLGPQQVVDLAAPEPRAHHVHLGAHLLAQLFLLGDQAQVGGDVLRADDARALEHHVLEEVREPGDAGALVRRADVRHPAGGDRGRVVMLVEQETHAVRQLQLLDVDLRLLGRGQPQRRQQPQQHAGGSQPSRVHGLGSSRKADACSLAAPCGRIKDPKGRARAR